MEKSWGLLTVLLAFAVVELCNGLPMDLLSRNDGPNAQLIGVLVGAMVSVCVVIAFLGCACCQRRQGFKIFRDSPVAASVINETSLSEEDPGHVNPIANPEFTIFTPLSPSHHNNNVFRSHQPVISYIQNENEPELPNKLVNLQIDGIDVSSWFDGSQPDFPRSKLKYIRELGNGWFGRVVEGEAQGIVDDQQNIWTPVAVRILESSASAHEQALFLHEASMYRNEPSHPNILSLFGRSLEAPPLLLIEEFCPKGDLKKFLLENRSSSTSSVMTGLPLKFCCQLSSAVQFIHEKNIPHLDLAARTCQITSDLNIKLGDYGLAVNQYPHDYYQGTPAIPVRWCAPETLNYTNTTLQPKQVTCEGNIWSLGVSMWEICEWGNQPYDCLTDDEVVSQVMGAPHVRLPEPSLSVYYIQPLYRLMQLCWQSSESRPQIKQINSMLMHLLQQYQQNNASVSPSRVPNFPMENFDNRWDTFKPNTIVKTDNHLALNLPVDKITDVSSVSSSEIYINPEKQKSLSLTNLHGSMDNLIEEGETPVQHMDSWLQNVANHTSDMQYVRGLSQAIQALDSALASEQTSSSASSFEPSPALDSLETSQDRIKIEFKLGESLSFNKINLDESANAIDSILYSRRIDSGSETEDETWKRRIERGAYSEKVRQKSKSVADLMVLTHIDCSDTDSETPLQSLEYRVNYKNVRCKPNTTLESPSLMCGSEGNLLEVQDTFQEELRKLQEERRDSLLFVPACHSRQDEIPKTSTDKTISSNCDNIVIKPSGMCEDKTNICSSSDIQKTSPDINKTSIDNSISATTKCDSDDIKSQEISVNKTVMNDIRDLSVESKTEKSIKDEIEENTILKNKIVTSNLKQHNQNQTRCDTNDKNICEDITRENIENTYISIEEQKHKELLDTSKNKLELKNIDQETTKDVQESKILEELMEVSKNPTEDLNKQIKDPKTNLNDSFILQEVANLVSERSFQIKTKPHEQSLVKLEEQMIKSEKPIVKTEPLNSTTETISEIETLPQKETQLKLKGLTTEENIAIIPEISNLIPGLSCFAAETKGQATELHPDEEISKPEDSLTKIVETKVQSITSKPEEHIIIFETNSQILANPVLEIDFVVETKAQEVTSKPEEEIIKLEENLVKSGDNVTNLIFETSFEAGNQATYKLEELSNKTKENNTKSETKEVTTLIAEICSETEKEVHERTISIPEKQIIPDENVFKSETCESQNDDINKSKTNDTSEVTIKEHMELLKPVDEISQKSEDLSLINLVQIELSETEKQSKYDNQEMKQEPELLIKTEDNEQDYLINISNDKLTLVQNESLEKQTLNDLLNLEPSQSFEQFLIPEKVMEPLVLAKNELSEVKSNVKTNKAIIEISTTEPKLLLDLNLPIETLESKTLEASKLVRNLEETFVEPDETITLKIDQLETKLESKQENLQELHNVDNQKNNPLEISQIITCKKEDYSLVQNFINNERNGPFSELDKNIENSTKSLQTPEITSLPTNLLDLHDTSNSNTQPQPVNQVYNVYNVQIDHQPHPDVFESPIKNFYSKSFNETELITDISDLLLESDCKILENKSPEKLLSKLNLVCTNVPNDHLFNVLNTPPAINGFDSDLSQFIETLKDDKKFHEKRQQNKNSCNKVIPNVLNKSIMQDSEESISKLKVEDDFKDDTISINKEQLLKEERNINEISLLCEPNLNYSSTEGFKDQNEISSDEIEINEEIISGNVLINIETILENDTFRIPKKLSDLASDILVQHSLYINENSEINNTSISEITYNKVLNNSSNDSLHSPRKLSDIILDSLKNNPDYRNDSDFLRNEILYSNETFDNQNCSKPINYLEPEELQQNNLDTNSFNIITSTPFKEPLSLKKSDGKDSPSENSKFFSFVSEGDETSDSQSTVILGPCEDYTLGLYSGLKTTYGKYSDDDRPEEEILQFSSNFMPINEDAVSGTQYFPNTEFDASKNSVDYSLETWDRFLGKTLQDHDNGPASIFEHDNFSPRNDDSTVFNDKNNINDKTDIPNETFEIATKNEDDKICDMQNKTINLDNNFATELNKTFTIKDKTFNIADEILNVTDINSTFIKQDEPKDLTFILDATKDLKDEIKNIEENESETAVLNSWEPGEGWFLHPQVPPDSLTGDIDISGSDNTDENSYVRFTLDEECVNALRNELTAKLPHAQGSSHEELEPEEWDTEERNEVIVKYNVYATPLSPIPEESCCDDVYCDHTQHRDGSDSESDWSEPCLGRTSQLEDILVVDTETHIAQLLESPSFREPQHRHTPSQDSCCSNDTLFNLDDLNYGPIDNENSPQHQELSTTPQNELQEKDLILEIEITDCETPKLLSPTKSNEIENTNTQFIDNSDSIELNLTYTKPDINIDESEYDNSNKENTTITINSAPAIIEEPEAKLNKLELKLETRTFGVAPLPSPEDIPWKQIPASLLTYNEMVHPQNDKYEMTPSQNEDTSLGNTEETTETLQDNNEVYNDEGFHNNEVYNDKIFHNNEIYNDDVFHNNEVYNDEVFHNNEVYNDEVFHNNENFQHNDEIHQENVKLDEDLSDSQKECTLETDLYSNLTDIRFSGPCDAQLMSTSFSESVDYADERDWDSGSDTRSSSSGEFIWKEGEHEESLRALHAASLDVGVIEDIQPMDAIEEENSNTSEDSDDCEEDIEETEFVPSAWDAQATPTKSALRSPENSSKRKNQQKGVWFKKQKYHCVYEYPREPESPVQPAATDLWRPLSDFSNFTDWELDPDSCVPAAAYDDNSLDCRDRGYDPVLDRLISKNNYPLASGSSRHRDLYQLNPFPHAGTTGLPSSDEDFFISSSAQPFQSSSQFFPGQNNQKAKFMWQDYQSSSSQSSRDLSDNITPDSGIDDITPASLSDAPNLTDVLQMSPPKHKVQSLKCLAELATKKNSVNEIKSQDSLGGLRHTRNRLKLDLPPSPNSFTATRTFSMDLTNDPVVNREVPTFTTFGKTRFSVQHVQTPTEDSDSSSMGKQKSKNVSFEALPHKPLVLQPINTVYIVKPEEGDKQKPVVESVQGEASLLDSADEDSGIESSANATLERREQPILN